MLDMESLSVIAVDALLLIVMAYIAYKLHTKSR